MDLTEVVCCPEIRHGGRFGSYGRASSLHVMLLGLRLHKRHEVIQVHLVSLGKSFDEHILVDVADTELGKDRAKICDLDELFFLTSAP